MVVVVLQPHPYYAGLFIDESGNVFQRLVCSKDSKGYHTVTVRSGKKPVKTRRHVLVLEAFKGERPEGAVSRHLDGNPSNDHPSNLDWGTQKENMADSVVHGTHPNLSHPNTKLTAEVAAAIKGRLQNGESGSALAKEYGVSVSSISDIKYGRTWKDSTAVFDKE